MGVEYCISPPANFPVLHKLRMSVSFLANYMISLNVIGLYICKCYILVSVCETYCNPQHKTLFLEIAPLIEMCLKAHIVFFVQVVATWMHSFIFRNTNRICNFKNVCVKMLQSFFLLPFFLHFCCFLSTFSETSGIHLDPALLRPIDSLAGRPVKALDKLIVESVPENHAWLLLKSV